MDTSTGYWLKGMGGSIKINICKKTSLIFQIHYDGILHLQVCVIAIVSHYIVTDSMQRVMAGFGSD